MKKSRLLITLLLVIILFGCEESNKYTITEDLLNGNSIYIYESEDDVCAKWYTMGTAVNDDATFYIVNTCPRSYLIKINDEFISILDYVGDNDVDIDDLRALSFGYVEMYTSIQTMLDIDINDFILQPVIVKELNGKIMEPPMWDTLITLNLEISNIIDDIMVILSSPIGNNTICDDAMCRLLYSQGPINIIFTDGEVELLLELYDNHLNIKIEVNGEFSKTIYGINEPEQQVTSLYDKIYNFYLVTRVAGDN